MIDPDLIGQFGPDFTFPVERGANRKFAVAAHGPWSGYMEDEAAPMHPAFLSTANVLWGYSLERPRGSVFEGIDHDLSVPLHAEEAYQFPGRLPHVGETLTARACLESVTEKHGSRGGDLTFLVMLTEFHDTAGTLVAQARATTVTTRNAPDGDGNMGSAPPPYKPRYDSLEPPDPFNAIARQEWGALAVDNGPASVSTGDLTLHDMVRFQAACGEDNPLHYDLAHAQQAGFPGMFGLGMHQASALASYAVRWLGEENARSFHARFRNVFWVGDPLTYSGRVVALREENGRKLTDLELVCTRDSDQAVIVQLWMSFDLTN